MRTKTSSKYLLKIVVGILYNACAYSSWLKYGKGCCQQKMYKGLIILQLSIVKIIHNRWAIDGIIQENFSYFIIIQPLYIFY